MNHDWYDWTILVVDAAILIVIIMEGDFFKKKKRAAEKAWRKFMRDAKKYIHKKEVEHEQQSSGE